MSLTPLPALSPDLVRRGLALRPRTDADADFLRDLYLSTRWEEFAAAGWPEPAIREVVHQQFQLQTRHYDAHYPGAAWGIVEMGGEPAGRLYLQMSGGDLRVIDVALLPAHRGGGLGTALMRAVQAQAAALGAATVSLHVDMGSHAGRLYARLGFAAVEDRGLQRLMEWAVPGRPTASQVKAAS